MTPGPIVMAEGVSKIYRRGSRVVEALRGVTFRIEPGEIVVLSGPSGSGKTTLLNLLAALDRPDGGSLSVASENITGLSASAGARFRSLQVGMIFQAYNLLPQFTAIENVLLPMIAAGRADRKRAAELLQAVGLSERLAHRATELSGGEQQRVAIARALANDPPLLLADEPTGNLDDENSRMVMELLVRTCRERHATLLVATHDRGSVVAADKVLELRSGSLQR